MNDTNLNYRQRQALELINQSGGISRRELKNKLQGDLVASIPTIARDLSFLLKNGFVRVEGKGRNTKYFPLNDNPLLNYFDIDQYFALDPDKRSAAKKSFNFTVFDHLAGLFTKKELDEINRINKSFSGESLSLGRDIYLKELERFTIELSWKSSKIEGNTYSLLDTEALVKQKIEAPGHPKGEAIMILNHKRVFEETLKNIGEYKRITFPQVTQLHNFMVKGLDINTGIRSQAVGITGTVYKPLDNQWQIKENLEKTLAVVNKTTDPLEKALIILAMLSYLQPFTDGNKRTARMLANAVLLANDFYPLSYRSVDETFYKKALVLFYEQNSLYYLKKIVLDQYKFALETYFG